MGRLGTTLFRDTSSHDWRRANPFDSSAGPSGLTGGPWLRGFVCALNDARFAALLNVDALSKVAQARASYCTVNALTLASNFHVRFVRGETKALISAPGGHARIAVDGPEEIKVMSYDAVPAGYEVHSMSANARWVVFRKVDNAGGRLDFMLFDADAWPAF